MARSKILLDTNAYLRLAKSIRPLLNQPFGIENYSLYIHSELQKEFDKSERLQNKFDWVNRAEFTTERKNTISLSKAEKIEIERAYEFIWNYQKDEDFSLSRVDVLCLATSYTLQIPLVTDDQAMHSVAHEYEVAIFSTLQLLKLMLDCSHITLDEITAIVEYWKYLKDLPADFRNEFTSLFQNSNS